ncbi:MAG: hypothetical protein ACRCSR_01270 [Bacteroidales bacterium]
MKKVYSLILLLFVFCLQAFAQSGSFHVQGVPRPHLKQVHTPSVHTKSTKTDLTFTMDQIQNWTGTGQKRAALVIQWNDEKNPDALVWGYKWDGEATGADMLQAIVAADPRLFALLMKGTQFGTTLGGFGYDLNQANTPVLINGTTEKEVVNGVVETTSYDFDDWSCNDDADHWGSGWNYAYWAYSVRENEKQEFIYSSFGMSSRKLQDGSWDGWWFNKDMGLVTFSSTFTPAPEPVTTSVESLSKPAVYRSNNRLYGLENGSAVEFYTLSGVLLKREIANSSTMMIPENGYVIIRIINSNGVHTLK